MKKYRVRIFLSVLAVILLVLGIGLTTLAASVTVTEIESAHDPVFSPCIAFKPYDNSSAGTFTESHGPLEVTFTISPDLKTLNWSSNIPVSHVFVKGGSGGYDYHYTPAATSGDNLVAPSDKEISHVTFYYCETVTLIVRKDIVDESENSLNEHTAHKDVSFAVYVNDTPYTVSALSPLVLTGLTPGAFTVNESTTLPANYSYVSGNETVTVNSGTRTVTITNKYTPPEIPETVTLIVRKNIIDEWGNSLNESDAHKNVNFTVNVNGTPHTVSASSQLVLTGLTPGAFTVNESTTLPANYSYVSGNETVTVNSGTRTVTITNKYTPPEIPETVSLIVKKNIIDEWGNSLNENDAHKTVNFTVNVNGTPHTVSASSQLVLTGLTPGAFTVNESTSLPSNYSYVSGNETITVNSGTGTVTITNKYTPPSIIEDVTLIVKKNIIDADGNSLNEESAHKDVNFTVNVNGTSYQVSPSSQLVLSGLTPGAYTVNESTTMPANYSYVDGNKTVNIYSNTVTVTITNRYIPPADPETVTLVIQKTIIDGAGNSLNNHSDHKDVSFNVTVNGKAYTVKASTPLVLTGLTPGAFTVKETTLPLKYTYVDGNETITVNSGTATVTITNRYEQELPITSGADILIIMLGALAICGGLMVRKRMQLN